MKKLLVAATLFAGFVVACSSKKPPPMLTDASNNVDAPGVESCNILTQMGCAPGEKCTWIIDQFNPAPPDVGHIGCAPVSAADGSDGAPCAYTQTPNATAPCAAGYVCLGGTPRDMLFGSNMVGFCKTVCDSKNNVSPLCDATHKCVTYYGFLGSAGMENGGVCEGYCNPLTDNFFGHYGTARGSNNCAGNEMCDGFWSNATTPTKFSCSRMHMQTSTLYHRSLCTTADGCADPNGNPFSNGCASGYIPIVKDYGAGMNMYACVAFCAPNDCYTGTAGALDAAHCGANAVNRLGAAPHRCNSTDAMGTYNAGGTGAGGSNGDQCVYGWVFEAGSQAVLKSDYTDTTGLCMDHTLYTLFGSDGMTATTTPQPPCWSMPLTATNTAGGCYGATGSGSGSAADLTGCDATFLGCVSTTTGGVTTMFQKDQRNVQVHLPRMPYHKLAN